VGPSWRKNGISERRWTEKERRELRDKAADRTFKAAVWAGAGESVENQNEKTQEEEEDREKGRVGRFGLMQKV